MHNLIAIAALEASLDLIKKDPGRHVNDRVTRAIRENGFGDAAFLNMVVLRYRYENPIPPVPEPHHVCVFIDTSSPLAKDAEAWIRVHLPTVAIFYRTKAEMKLIIIDR